MAGEAEEFGDGDDLVASGLEGGDQGLHGLYGALVRVVEEEDAAILDAGEGLGHTILDRHVGPPILTAQAGYEYLPADHLGDVGVVCREGRTEVHRLRTGVGLGQGIGLGDLRKNQRVRNLREIRVGIGVVLHITSHPYHPPDDRGGLLGDVLADQEERGLHTVLLQLVQHQRGAFQARAVIERQGDIFRFGILHAAGVAAAIILGVGDAGGKRQGCGQHIQVFENIHFKTLFRT